MVEKTRGKCFDCYFYKNNVWDDIFAKHVVWAAKKAIFSLFTKRDKQIEKRIRRLLHGYVQMVDLLLLLIFCTQLALVSYKYYLAPSLPFGIFSLS
jgi:hypothetical protein